MTYKTQDYWVFGLCPMSGIQKNTIFRKLDLFPSLGEDLVPLERANFSHYKVNTLRVCFVSIIHVLNTIRTNSIFFCISHQMVVLLLLLLLLMMILKQ
jgi:hypothetical protein